MEGNRILENVESNMEDIVNNFQECESNPGEIGINMEEEEV